mgnify:CR=1 FL=1
MSSLGILCPGQGAQHAQMLALLAAEPAALAVLAQAEAVLGMAPATLAAGPELFTNAVAQPLICTAELATWARWRTRSRSVATQPARSARSSS